jgi:hypothetical protein
MARSPSRGDLFITVGGDVAPLRASMKAGQSVLNEFGQAAIDVQAEVSKAFAQMAANAPTEAKKLEQSYARTFAEIRKNAQSVLSASSGQGAVQILNVAGAQQAAAAAEAEAGALRQVANAAIAADRAANGTNAGVRLLAISSEAAAQEAEQHAAAMRDQAATLGIVAGKLDITTGAQKRVAAASGQTRIGMQQLGFQLNDVAVGLASGQRPAIVFAQQISQVTQAVQLMSGGTSKFASFMGGAWGIGLTLAVTVLAPLVAKMFEGADAAKKYTSETDLLAAALRGETISTDALIESLQKLNEQELKALDNDTKLIDVRYRLAKATLAAAEANKTQLETQLATAKADLEAAGAAQSRAASGGKGALEAASGEVALRQSEVDRLQRAVESQTTIIGQATAQLSTEMVRFARNAATEVGKVNIAFDRRQEALEAQFHGVATTAIGANGKALTTLRGGLLNDPSLTDARRQQLLNQLIKKEHDLNVERQKAIGIAQKLDNAEQGKNQHDASNRQSGRQIDFNQAAAIARAAGLQVNSAFRTNAQQAALFNDPSVNRPGNPVAKPGTSAHNGANGKWAIDIQITDGVNPAKIRKIFGDQGVSLSKVLKENGHFHIEGSRSSAAAAERAQDKAADLKRNQNDNFAGQMQRLDEQLLDARGQLLQGVAAQARFATAQVDEDQRQYELAVHAAVGDDKLRAAQGELLIQKNQAVADQKRANIIVRSFIQQQEELQRDADQEYGFKNDQLEYQRDIARTTGKRLNVELEIIDALYEHKKNVLEIQRKSAVEAQNWAEVARIDKDLANLAPAKARDVDRANRANRSPLDEFKNELPESLDDVKEKLEDIAAIGLRQLNDDASAALAKFLGLKGEAADLAAQLIKLGLMILESYLGGGNPLGGLFGGARAGGGAVNDNRFYLVGENGPELFAPGRSGTIIPNHVIENLMPPRVPRSVYARPRNDSAWRRGSDQPPIQNFYFPNSDHDSFRRNERQLARTSRRALGDR